MTFSVFEKTGLGPVFLLLAIIAILGIVMLMATKTRAPAFLYVVAGVAMIALLWTAGIPPNWFDGGWEGFGLSVFLLLWAFVSDRKFGRPLLVGMGVTLLVLNFIAHF